MPKKVCIVIMCVSGIVCAYVCVCVCVRMYVWVYVCVYARKAAFNTNMVAVCARIREVKKSASGNF